jgi:ABC transporter
MPEYPDLISAQADGAVALQGAVMSFRGTDGPVRAARGVDLPGERGETVAVVGPNGAGKSRTLDMLLGLTEPDAGAELTGLLALADRLTQKLSGGQAQRVRLRARARQRPRAARARRADCRARRRGPPRLLGHGGGSWFPISGHGFLQDLAQAFPPTGSSGQATWGSARAAGACTAGS